MVPLLSDALASYVPVLVTRRLAADVRPLTSPCSEILPAAVLCADISGFTAATEVLVRQGPAGVEKVGAGLDGYFGRLVAIIESHGGDVVKFAGDAVTAIWLPPDPADLRGAILPAITCGLAIQADLHGYHFADGAPLSLRVGIGASRIAAVHVGGVGGHWELVLTGSALTQAQHAETRAHPGEVVVGPRAWSLLADHAESESPDADGYVRVTRLCTEVACTPLARPSLPAAAEAALRGYVPAAVATRLAAGQRSWLTELRRVAVVFVHLPAVTYATPLDHAQAAMLALQDSIYAAEGSINHVSANTTGATVMAVFGLPPLAHEDDPLRALDAAINLRRVLQALSGPGVAPPMIGVAAGKAFCGAVGSKTRCEYTVLGDVVNLAARLMQAATPERPILCDSPTFMAGRGQFMFETYPEITVKGKSQPVAIYGPIGGRIAPRATRELSRPMVAAARSKQRPALVGRMRERVVLVGKLHELLRGHSATVVVEGEAGLGKSRLADDLLEHAEAMGITRLVGAREAADAAAAYHAWTPIFRTILGLDDADGDPWVRVEATIKQLYARSGRPTAAYPAIAHAPLLASALALSGAETERTAALAGKIRAVRTRELLLEILRASLCGRPALLLIEDAHWVDSASWALLAHVRAQVENLLVVLVTGPIDADTDPAPSELRQVLADAGTFHLQLGPLSLAETEALVSRKLGVSHTPDAVIEFIYGRAEGHPLFTEELASALRDAGLLSVIGGECYVAPEAGDLKTAQFPDNLEAVITSRIDRLSPQVQLVVKVASVLGRVFSLSLLRAVYPIDADRDNLGEHVAMLERRGLVQLRGGTDKDPRYGFKHALTQEVAYNLLPFSQRQQLHQAVAEHHERVHAQRIELHYPLLAHHWYRVVAPGRLVTEDTPGPALVTRATEYLQRAADQALRNGVGQEAVEHYSHALEILPGLPPSSARTEQEIALQVGLGNALIAARGVASDEVEQTFARARELCREVGETKHLFPVLFGLWMFYFVRAEHRVARELAEQLLVFAEHRRERVPQLIAHCALGTQLFHLGELAPARNHLERAVGLYAPNFDHTAAFVYIYDPRVACLSCLAICLHLLDFPGEADERCKVALALTRELGHAATSAWALGHAAILRQIAGQEATAREHVLAHVQLGNEHGTAAWHAFAQVVQGWSMAEQGQLSEGLDLVKQAIVDLQVAGMSVFWPWVMDVYADLCARAGNLDEAIGHVREAIQTSQQSGARVWEAALLCRLAALEQRQTTTTPSQSAPGEAALLAAIQLARSQGARALELRAALALAAVASPSPAAQEVLAATSARFPGRRFND